MATLTTEAIQRDLRASLLEEDARKLAEAIRATDGNVPGEVDSIRKTVMEYRAEVWRRQPSFDLQQRDSKQDTILAQQLPSPTSEISNDPRGLQAVSLTVTDKEIFGDVDKLVNRKDNEMVQNMLKDLRWKRKAADEGQGRTLEGAFHASELKTEALRPRKSAKKVRSAIHQHQYYGSDTEIEDISDFSADKGNDIEMLEAPIPADLDQKFHGFDVLHEALELVAAAETMTQLQRKDISVGKKKACNPDASTFTDVVLGTLQDVAVKLGANGDAPLIRGIASVIGQEGEQNGFYRSLLGKIPSALPFLSASARESAFSALNQNFVVPGSCPNSNIIALPIFGVLDVQTQNIQPQDQTLQFSFAASDSISSADGLSLVYINQQNAPVVEPITGAQNSGGVITFSAPFLYTKNLMNGLTIAAVTNGSGPFASVVMLRRQRCLVRA